MELSNEFTVGVPLDEAWAVLTNVERIAPCMPGAQLQEIEGDEYRGVVKVKVGPITAQYKGAARFVEQDAPLKAVLRAEGRDVRGQGNASATITATLEPEGAATRVTVATDLTVTGRVAQFGRGVLADVSGKLLGQFVECLERDLLGGAVGVAPETSAHEEQGGTEASRPDANGAGRGAQGGEEGGDQPSSGGAQQAPAPPAPEQSQVAPGHGGGVRRVDQREVAPVDLLDTAGGPVAKRVLPIVGVLVVIFWLLRRRRH